MPVIRQEPDNGELLYSGRALIARTFREHAAAMEAAVGVLSKEARLVLRRLLKLGKGGKDDLRGAAESPDIGNSQRGDRSPCRPPAYVHRRRSDQRS